MSWGGGAKITTPDPTIAGAETEDYSLNQEAIPIPWLAGERRVAVRWLSRTYNQFTREAPQERPGKK